MLFRVVGTNVYVCGSIHLLPVGTVLPQAMLDAVGASDHCIFETDIDNWSEPSYARFQAPETIKNHITAELYLNTEALCEALSLPGLLPELQPWFVALFLGIRLIARDGFTSESGVDAQLLKAARLAGKSVFRLEADSTIGFASAPMSEHIDRLTFVVLDPQRSIDIFQQIHAAWRIGDTDALERLNDVQLKLFPVSTRALIDDRNRQWLPGFLGAIQAGRRAVFVVGAFHLVGENGLQRLLENHGYKLELIATAGSVPS